MTKMRGRGRTIELDRMINCLFGARYLRALAAFGPDRTAARSAALAEALCAAGDEGAPRPWRRRPGALLSPAGPGATAAALCRSLFPAGVRPRPRQGWERQRQPLLALGPALVRCATEGTSKARNEAASLRVPSALGTGPALKARLVCRWLESSLVCACACLRGRRGPAGPRLCRRGKARLGLGVCWGGSEWRGKGGGGRVRLVMRERSESSDKGDSAQALSGRGGG